MNAFGRDHDHYENINHCDTKHQIEDLESIFFSTDFLKITRVCKKIQNFYICRSVCCLIKIVGVQCFCNDHGHEKFDTPQSSFLNLNKGWSWATALNYRTQATIMWQCKEPHNVQNTSVVTQKISFLAHTICRIVRANLKSS